MGASHVHMHAQANFGISNHYFDLASAEASHERQLTGACEERESRTAIAPSIDPRMSYEALFLASEAGKSAEYLRCATELRKLRDDNRIDPKVLNEPYLFRYAKAKKFDVNIAKEFLQKNILWRRQNDIDRILQNFTFTEAAEVYKRYPHGYHKTDKEGRPVYIEVYKKLRLKELYLITTEERLRRHFMQTYEVLVSRIFPGASLAVGRHVGQLTIILDLKDTKMGVFEVKRLVQAVSSFSNSNYPEIMSNLFVVNAPSITQVCWKLIKVLLNERTRAKINFLGGNYQTVLLEHIPKENLPEFLGGTSETNAGELLGRNIGPWNDFGKLMMFPHERLYLSEADRNVFEVKRAN